jgi:hypothetical protein
MFNFSVPFCPLHLVAWPATLQIIFKNDAKRSFFDSRLNLFSQSFHVFIFGTCGFGAIENERGFVVLLKID